MTPALSRSLGTLFLLTLACATGSVLTPERGLRLEARAGEDHAGPVVADRVIRRISHRAVRGLLTEESAAPLSLTWSGWIHADEGDPWVVRVVAGRPITVVAGSTVALDEIRDGSAVVPLTGGMHRLQIRSSHPAGLDRFRVVAHPRSREGTLAVLDVDAWPARTTRWQQVVRGSVDTVAPWIVLGWCVVVVGGIAWAIVRLLRRMGIDLWPGYARPAQVLMFGLALWGVEWGVPSGSPWPPDELEPGAVVERLRQGFSGGWASVYPPMHFYTLAVVVSPALAFDAAGVLRLESDSSLWAMMLAQRLFSVVLAVLLVGAVGALTERIRPAAAPLATLGAALFVLLVYYGKTANVETAYVFWVVVSAVFLLDWMQDPRRHAALYGVALTSALAVITKDQAYGFYAALPILLIWGLQRLRPAGRSPAEHVFRSLLHPPLWKAALLGVVVLVVGHNLAFNWSGFWRHVDLIAGGHTQGHQAFPNTLAGHVDLQVMSWRLAGWAMTWPALLTAAFGFGLALRDARTRRPALVILALVLGYIASVLHVVLYTLDRYFMAPALLSMPFFGMTIMLVWGAATERWLAIRRAAVVALLAFMLAYAVSPNVLMSLDTRYEAERWLRRHLDPLHLDRVGALHRRMHVPRVPELIPVTVSALPHTGACVLLVNESQTGRFAEGTGRGEVIGRLRRGDLGFQPVAFFEARRPRWVPLTRTWIFQEEGADGFSNLDKISPSISVYAKPGCPALKKGYWTDSTRRAPGLPTAQ